MAVPNCTQSRWVECRSDDKVLTTRIGDWDPGRKPITEVVFTALIA
jgi:hypothetical protein